MRDASAVASVDEKPSCRFEEIHLRGEEGEFKFYQQCYRTSGMAHPLGRGQLAFRVLRVGLPVPYPIATVISVLAKVSNLPPGI